MKNRFWFAALLLLLAASISSCSSFVLEEDSKKLRAIERDNGNPVDYILLHDIERNGVVLKKGTPVRIVIAVGDDWIKVYAYDSSQKLLYSKRLLILYLFKEDFPDETYSENLFRQKLQVVLRRK